jgi:hypothetical protein
MDDAVAVALKRRADFAFDLGMKAPPAVPPVSRVGGESVAHDGDCIGPPPAKCKRR